MKGITMPNPNSGETQEEGGFLTEERGNRKRVEEELARRIAEDKELHPENEEEDNE